LVDWAKPRISPSAKARLKHLLSLYRRRLPAPVYKPNAQLTALYRARCRVSIERAARELGYRPVYDLVRGMNVTGMWLRWALDPEEK
jgi:nucleoside-diphosphate-sugar epimerase